MCKFQICSFIVEELYDEIKIEDLYFRATNGNGRDICVNCLDILYYISDAVKDKNKDEYEKWVKEVKNYSEKKTEKGFEQWFAEDFLKRNEL